MQPIPEIFVAHRTFNRFLSSDVLRIRGEYCISPGDTTMHRSTTSSIMFGISDENRTFSTFLTHCSARDDPFFPSAFI